MKNLYRLCGLLCLMALMNACTPSPSDAAAPTLAPTTPYPSPTTHPTVTAIATHTPTEPVPSPTLSPTVSPSPEPAAWGRIIDTVNCRMGPSTDFPISASLDPGAETAILGVSPERTWWLIQPPFDGPPCWVWGPLVDVFQGNPAAVALTNAPATLTPIPQNAGNKDFTVEEYENTLFDLLNLARAQNGLPPAERVTALETAARLHSVDMAEHDFFAHLSYDGRDFNTRLTEQSLFFTNGGETIYAGGDPYQAYHIWMGSDVHRNIILHPSFTSLGVGVVYADANAVTYNVYVTADFAALYVP